jgi:hypothetical protein
MTNKGKYRELCKKERDIPIFSKDWWMDTVCGKDNWDVVLIEKDGKIIASLPYFKKKKYGFNIITMPPLTQNFKLWIKCPENQKYRKKLSFENKIILELIDKLPKYDMFNLNFHYSLTNWLPFYWKGFKQTTRYTYVIEDLSELEEIFNNFSYAKKKNIKKAKKIVEVKSDLSPKDFYENHRLTLKKQSQIISYSFEVLKNIYNEVYSHDSGKVFYAIDDKNNLHAALLIIWDNIQAYDLISTIDPDYRANGAATLLIKEAIKYVSKKTNKFDFEGSMIESVENSFRQFGAIQKPYFNISKINSKILQLLNLFIENSIFIKNIVKKFIN